MRSKYQVSILDLISSKGSLVIVTITMTPLTKFRVITKHFSPKSLNKGFKIIPEKNIPDEKAINKYNRASLSGYYHSCIKIEAISDCSTKN